MSTAQLDPLAAEYIAARERWLAAEERAREARGLWLRAMTIEDARRAAERWRAADAARDEAAEVYAAAGRALEAHAERGLGVETYAALRRAIAEVKPERTS